MSSLLVIGTSLALLGGLAGAAEARRPNLILILADDLGYETLGANRGTSYRTPALDRWPPRVRASPTVTLNRSALPRACR